MPARKLLSGFLAAVLFTALPAAAKDIVWKQQTITIAKNPSRIAVYDPAALDILESLGVQTASYNDGGQPDPAKLAAAWLRFTLPLLAMLPLLALMLHIPAANIPATAALLALGSLPLLLIGALGAVLTLTQTHGTFLRFLIVVPLYIPVLIIGVTAGHDNLLGLTIGGHYALLGAFSLFALITIIPFATLALKAQHLP